MELSRQVPPSSSQQQVASTWLSLQELESREEWHKGRNKVRAPVPRGSAPTRARGWPCWLHLQSCLFWSLWIQHSCPFRASMKSWHLFHKLFSVYLSRSELLLLSPEKPPFSWPTPTVLSGLSEDVSIFILPVQEAEFHLPLLPFLPSPTSQASHGWWEEWTHFTDI